MRPHLTCLALASLTIAGAASAETFVRYDEFNTLTTIDNLLWQENETVRFVRNGELHFGLGTAGANDLDTGTHTGIQTLKLTAPQSVIGLASDIEVDYLATPACAANPAVGFAKLRLGGSFFNVGTPTPGDSTGDVFAWITIGRSSNSTAADGEMVVMGSVILCKSNGCQSQQTLGTVDLGHFNRTTRERFKLALNRHTKTFEFQRAGGERVGVTYTVPDKAAPGLDSKAFNVANATPNCAGGSPLVTKIVARLDNVSVKFQKDE
jgi:hypothetical protein